jgi:methionine synthase I (cobalamin-dependent)
MRRDFEELFPDGGAVLLDGAMGTALRAAGWPDGKDTLLANQEAPDLVLAIHAAFVASGARVLLTNTFAAPFAAAMPGADWRTAVSGGVEIARRAKGPRRVKIGGCVGVSVPDQGELLAESIRVLSECGVDLLVLETVTRADDARQALEPALKSGVPVVLCASSTGGGGEDEFERIREIESVAQEAGEQVMFGLNCCRGPADVLRIAESLDLWPLWVKPNTGVRDHASARQMAAFSSEARERGSRFIGGCCGVDAEMLKAMGECLAG